jgi:hypothetical protein
LICGLTTAAANALSGLRLDGQIVPINGYASLSAKRLKAGAPKFCEDFPHCMGMPVPRRETWNSQFHQGLSATSRAGNTGRAGVFPVP